MARSVLAPIGPAAVRAARSVTNNEVRRTSGCNIAASTRSCLLPRAGGGFAITIPFSPSAALHTETAYSLIAKSSARE